MFTKKLFTKKPKTAFAAMAALIISSLLVTTSATAENLILNIEGEHIQSVEPDGIRTRTFKTEIELETGTMLTLGLDGQFVSTDPHIISDGFWIKLKINEIEIVKGKKTVSLSVSLMDNINGEERVLSEPTLTAVYGEAAEFKIVTDFDHETGTVLVDGKKKEFSLKFTPQAKT